MIIGTIARDERDVGGSALSGLTAVTAPNPRSRLALVVHHQQSLIAGCRRQRRIAVIETDFRLRRGSDSATIARIVALALSNCGIGQRTQIAGHVAWPGMTFVLPDAVPRESRR
jgi:hypothetical protein